MKERPSVLLHMATWGWMMSVVLLVFVFVFNSIISNRQDEIFGLLVLAFIFGSWGAVIGTIVGQAIHRKVRTVSSPETYERVDIRATDTVRRIFFLALFITMPICLINLFSPLVVFYCVGLALYFAIMFGVATGHYQWRLEEWVYKHSIQRKRKSKPKNDADYSNHLADNYLVDAPDMIYLDDDRRQAKDNASQ